MTSEKKPPENENVWAQVAKYSEIAFIFPAATVVGLLAGMALDHWLHTHWLYMAGLILGIVAGFIQLVRAGMSSGTNQ
ncbi:MAG TPA: AtpZ/AtpI family protein [Terriglobales bacterium]